MTGVATSACRGDHSGSSSHSLHVTRGRGARTAFGSVAVLGATWASTPAGAALHGHGDHHRREDPAEGAGHGVWSRTVRVRVEVHNGLDRPLLFSPGQFRLRVGHHGVSVTPYDAEGPTRGLPADSTLDTWVAFLTPDDAHDLAVEFTEAGADEALSLAVTPVATVGAPS